MGAKDGAKTIEPSHPRTLEPRYLNASTNATISPGIGAEKTPAGNVILAA